jgi:hypothetical protein
VYWEKKINFKINYASSDSCLFRFLGNYGFNFKKKILEIGFFHGADLLEFKKRGSSIYGLEINKFCVNKFKKKIGKYKIKHFDAKINRIPFKIKFDLIFSRDFINYLNLKEIENHIDDIYRKLNVNGLTLVVFLEQDLKKNKKNDKTGITINNEKLYYKESKFTPKKNPVLFYNSKEISLIYKKHGFKQVGKKFTYETFDTSERLMKKTRYLLFKK